MSINPDGKIKGDAFPAYSQSKEDTTQKGPFEILKQKITSLFATFNKPIYDDKSRPEAITQAKKDLEYYSHLLNEETGDKESIEGKIDEIERELSFLENPSNNIKILRGIDKKLSNQTQKIQKLIRNQEKQIGKTDKPFNALIKIDKDVQNLASLLKKNKLSSTDDFKAQIARLETSIEEISAKENSTLKKMERVQSKLRELGEQIGPLQERLLEKDLKKASTWVKEQFNVITKLIESADADQKRKLFTFLQKREEADLKIEEVYRMTSQPSKGKWYREQDINNTFTAYTSLELEVNSPFYDAMESQYQALKSKADVYKTRFVTDQQYREAKIERTLFELTKHLSPKSALSEDLQKKLKEHMRLPGNNEQVEKIVENYQNNKNVILSTKDLSVINDVIAGKFDNLPRPGTYYTAPLQNCLIDIRLKACSPETNQKFQDIIRRNPGKSFEVKDRLLLIDGLEQCVKLRDRTKNPSKYWMSESGIQQSLPEIGDDCLLAALKFEVKSLNDRFTCDPMYRKAKINTNINLFKTVFKPCPLSKDEIETLRITMNYKEANSRIESILQGHTDKKKDTLSVSDLIDLSDAFYSAVKDMDASYQANLQKAIKKINDLKNKKLLHLLDSSSPEIVKLYDRTLDFLGPNFPLNIDLKLTLIALLNIGPVHMDPPVNFFTEFDNELTALENNKKKAQESINAEQVPPQETPTIFRMIATVAAADNALKDRTVLGPPMAQGFAELVKILSAKSGYATNIQLITDSMKMAVESPEQAEKDATLKRYIDNKAHVQNESVQGNMTEQEKALVSNNYIPLAYKGVWGKTSWEPRNNSLHWIGGYAIPGQEEERTVILDLRTLGDLNKEQRAKAIGFVEAWLNSAPEKRTTEGDDAPENFRKFLSSEKNSPLQYPKLKPIAEAFEAGILRALNSSFISLGESKKN